MSCKVEVNGELPELSTSIKHVSELEELKEPDCAEVMVANGDAASPMEGAATRGFCLMDEMLDYLSHSKGAYFKSQQIGEPELTVVQKREIARDMLQRSSGQFLARFGYYLEEKHLEYFTDDGVCDDDYEVQYHVRQLQRFHSKRKNQVSLYFGAFRVSYSWG
ncbi:hypothetical protein PR048_001308 [Dryococelus australis]|uniref:Uncharacterized protein n=1 Tax=Dryococelus australis TaxID=614101 RepID=A0ABQ9IH16_9NEOP|nr:hypothetical protein PR048_001308 [Dryococelus australis]